MFSRAIIFSVFLFFTTSCFAASTGLAAANTAPATEEKVTYEQYTDDNIIVYKWIDGVRWIFILDPDGGVIECYPDPDY